MLNQVTKETKINITNLYQSAVYFVPRSLDDDMIDLLSKTALKLVLKLNRYFSTETGRTKQKKVYNITDLRQELGTNGKVLSRNALTKIIEQIKENNLFLIEETYNGKEKVYNFFAPSAENFALINDIKDGKFYLKSETKTNILKSNIIEISEEKNKFHSLSSESHSLFSDTHSLLSDNEITKKIQKRKKSDNDENPKTLINTSFDKSLKSRQDYYIKDYNIKDYFSKDNFTQSNFDKELEKETKKINKETSILDYSFSKLANQENKKTDNSEKEKVIQELKNFGITSNIESLFKFNSIAEIKKQLEYHSFRENKTPGILYNAIKNKETAPAEYKKHLYRIENQNFDKEYSKLIYGVGSSCDENIENKKAYLTHAIISKLYKYGFINTNNSTLNNELQFNYADNENYVIDTLIKPLKTFLENKKLQNLIDLIKEGIELIKKDNAYYLEKPLINDLFNNKGVNIFSIEKAIVKAKNMGV